MMEGRYMDRPVILVVEDEPALRDLLEVIFTEDLHYQVKIAADGEEALGMIEKENIKPDLLITDVVMPGINGRELFEQIQKNQPDLKVIFMSGYAQDNLREEDKKYPFIPKPFNITEISEKVAEVLK